MHVDVVDTPAGLAALKENWEAVYGADPEAQFFLSWTWIANWLEHLGAQWLVLAAKESPEAPAYGAFFPLRLRTRLRLESGFYNELRMAGGWFAGYTGLICDPAIEERAIPAFADFILGLNWASFKLDNFYSSEKRRALLLEPLARGDFVLETLKRPDDGDEINRDIYLVVKLPLSFDAYLREKLSANARKKARRLMRRLEESQTLRITHADAASFARDCGALLELWEAQWGARFAACHGPHAVPEVLSHYRTMLTRCFEAGSLFLPVLWDKEKPIGAIGTLVDAKRRALYSFVSARDVTIKGLQPGFLLDLHSIRWAVESGFATYDLLAGDFPYKRSLGPEERRVEWQRVRTRSLRNLGGRMDPRSLPIVLEWAQSLYAQGDFIRARMGAEEILNVEAGHAGARALRQALEGKHPLSPAADIHAAVACHRRGELDAAEQIYRALLAREPKHFDALHLLGVTYLQRGKLEEAERQIARALKIAPDAAVAHYNRGSALRRLGRLKEALASFERAIALKPDYERALADRAQVLRDLAQGEAKGARGSEAGARVSSTAPRRPRHYALNVAVSFEDAHLSEADECALTVRDYSPRDRPGCLAVFDSNVPEYFAAHERRDFVMFLDKLPGPYLVIEERGRIVACGGFARYAQEPDAVALTWGMVAQGLHKKGLGRVLLLERVKRAIRAHAGKDIVIYTSQRTAGFFARFGFETRRVICDHFAPGLDLHKMRLKAPDARRHL